MTLDPRLGRLAPRHIGHLPGVADHGPARDT